MAETVWSESKPLVINSLSPSAHVIIVSQSASESPPGGIRTA